MATALAARVVLCLVPFLVQQPSVAATPTPAPLTARVTDHIATLSADALAYLSSSIEEGEKGGGPRIRAVVIDAERGLVLDDYAQALLAAQPAAAGIDALLVLQPAAQTARIAVADAATKRLSTIDARVILRESVLPYLRDGNPFAAIEQGTRRIEARLRAGSAAALASASAATSAASLAVGAAASATRVASAGIDTLPPRAPITDLTGTLAAPDLEGLRADVAALQTRTGAEVAILMVPSARPDTLEALALRVFDAWKLGRKGIDDGVLILVARDDRQMRIEVGYGLEGALTDLASGRIIAEHVRPQFRRGDFGGGLAAALEQVGRAVAGSPTAAPAQPEEYWSSWPSTWALVVAGLIVLGAMVSRFWLPALAASLLALAGCAAVMWMNHTGVGTTLFIGCFAAALTFMLPAALLGEGRSSSGGSGGSGGRSGSSSGAGGGSSGGGGASGSW
jgi:uncharacterized protein